MFQQSPELFFSKNYSELMAFYIFNMFSSTTILHLFEIKIIPCVEHTTPIIVHYINSMMLFIP